jgi:hypothetical protein
VGDFLSIIEAFCLYVIVFTILLSIISNTFIQSKGGLIIPPAKHKRSDIQQQSIRDAEIPPEKYYPEGYAPELITEWPTDKPLFIPAEAMNK